MHDGAVPRQTEIEIHVPDRGTVRDSISVTALKRFWRCPLAFWFAYVARAGRPVSAGEWSLGAIVHGTLKRLFDLPPEHRAYEILFELVLAEWRVDHPNESFDFLNLARARAAAIMRLVDVQGIDVRGTEIPVEQSLAGFTLRGRIDLLYRDADGANVIADYKSHLRPPRSPLQDPILTLRTYDLLLSPRYAKAEVETALELLILEPARSVRVGPIGPSERLAHRAEVASRLDDIAAAAETGIWRGRVRPSCEGCAYFENCPAVAQARRPKGAPSRVSLKVDDLRWLEGE